MAAHKHTFLFLKIKIIALIKPIFVKGFVDQDVNGVTLRYTGKKGLRGIGDQYVFFIHSNGTNLVSKFKRINIIAYSFTESGFNFLKAIKPG